MNLNLFYTIDVNFDRMGYANPKRLTRTAIEAHLDLYNYYNVENYIEVLQYNSRDRKEDKGYDRLKINNVVDKYKVGKVKQKNGLILKPVIDLMDKCKIAEQSGYDINNMDFIKKAIREYNEFVHINLKQLNFEEYSMRVESSKMLLRINLTLLAESLRIFLERRNFFTNQSEVINNFTDKCSSVRDDIISSNDIFEDISTAYNVNNFQYSNK